MKNALKLFSLTVMLSLTASLSNATPLLASDTIPRWGHPRWRVEMIAQDLLRFDSLSSEYQTALLNLQTWEEIASVRLRQIYRLQRVNEEKEIRIAILQAWVQLQQQDKERIRVNLTAQVKKAKRQRNKVIVVVVLAGAGKIAYDLLKR